MKGKNLRPGQDDPFKSLASAIILKAVRDFKHGPYLIKRDCKKFFQSEYFELLADIALLDCDAARAALHIDMPSKNKAEREQDG